MKTYLQTDDAPSKPTDVDWLAGTCILMKHDLFKQLDGFDDRFYLFFEDTDLCRRSWQRGKRVVYVPDVQAGDKPQRLSGRTIADIVLTPNGRTHIISACKYFWKWKWQPKKRPVFS